MFFLTVDYDGSCQIDANLLLNKMKKKAQFLYVNYMCFLQEPIKMRKLKLELR